RPMWSPEALEFLRELEANNDRDWFKANRERYDAHLLEPARALAEALRHLGSPHFFRPYNDTRFHMRPPIKEQLGVAIGYGAAASSPSPAATRSRPGCTPASATSASARSSTPRGRSSDGCRRPLLRPKNLSQNPLHRQHTGSRRRIAAAGLAKAPSLSCAQRR